MNSGWVLGGRLERVKQAVVGGWESMLEEAVKDSGGFRDDS